MGKAAGRVVLGWACGFLIAVAWGANRAHDGRLAATFLACALIGLAVLAVMLIAVALGEGPSEAAEGPAAVHELEPAEAPAATREPEPAETPMVAHEPEPAIASPPQQAGGPKAIDLAGSAARIAEIEARLALEEERLQAAVDALAAADVAGTPEVIDPHLREEFLESVAGLVASRESIDAETLVHELEGLLEDAS